MDDSVTFGIWLRRRRKALDLTQAQCAQQVGCSLQTIQKLEAEERRPSLAMAERLADVLELAPTDRGLFLKVARAELAADQFAVPTALVPPPSLSPGGRSLPHLPLSATPLIGREHDIATLTSLLLRPTARLVTLIGPGGIGKTRLSLAAATSLRDSFRDGVSFVDLAPIREPALVASAIAHAFGLTESASQSLLVSLKGYLRAKHLLLLLDNFEHLMTAAPLLTDLLQAAPHLTVLVTSRTVLHLSGEHEIPVAPLALPDPSRHEAQGAVSAYASVALFIQRAQLVKPDFQVTNTTAPAVAEICVRLDGLPLAIELAAARVKVLAPEALLARLDQRLKLLTGGPRDVTARQQTLRGAIDWSYDLLDLGEQHLFRRLAVFVGGWTLEAAEAVCSADGELEVEVLDGLASLIDKSLLYAEEEPGTEPRFGMLETMREYALERLTESGDVHVLQQAHVRFFLALAERAAPQMDGPEQALWHQRLEVEHDNLRAALRASRVLPDGAELELRLVVALVQVWALDHVSEVRHLLERALERGHDAPQGVWARALREAGNLAWQQSDYAVALDRYHESVVLFRQLGDQSQIAYGLDGLAITALMQGDIAAARAASEEVLALHHASGDEIGIAGSYLQLGFVAVHAGEFEAAKLVLEEALRRWEQVGDTEAIATTLMNLGIATVNLGDIDHGTVLLQEALARFQEVTENSDGVGWALRELGIAAYMQGDYITARVLLQRSIPLFREQGHTRDVVVCLECVAGVYAMEGRAERAVRVLGAAERLRDNLGAPLLPLDSATYVQTVAAARAQLDEATWATAWAEGQAMTLEQAIAYAMETAS